MLEKSLRAAMTSLWVNSDRIPLPIDLSALPEIDDRRFYDFCRTNPDLRIERNATGDIVVMAPTFADTGNRNGRIFGQLFVWSEANGTGEVFDSSSGFTLPNGAIRSPDVSWILADRWNSLSSAQKASFAPIAPDFVVELRSSSDSLSTLQEKMAEYIANGVRLGLLIDRQNRRVYVYRLDREVETLTDPDKVSCEPELPGFVLKMAKIW